MTGQVRPTGEQIEIRHGLHAAVIVEVGGGLREYTFAGRQVIDGYGEQEMASSGRGQVLLPWPNRIQDGSYEFDGRRHQLALSEPLNHNASHGLVRWSAWLQADRSADRVVMRHVLRPQPGYPFTLDVSIAYVLSDQGLSVTTTAVNIGSAACPFGSGAHPYLTLGTPAIDELLLCVPARTVIRPDERGIPRDALAVTGTDFDFRAARLIGPMRLDHAFTDLERDGDGLARVRLRDPASGRGVTLWAGAAYSHVMVFTGDTLATGARRGVAIEPMTCPPNAFRSGIGVIRLERGQSVTGTWGIRPEQG